MKKIYINTFAAAIILISAYIYSYSQSLELISPDTLVRGTVTESPKSYTQVKNNSSTGKSVKVRKIENLLEGQKSSFCWGDNCWPPERDTSLNAEIIMAGETTPREDFDLQLSPYGVIGISYVTVVFYDVDNPQDSIAYTVKFDITLTSVDDPSLSVRTSYCYPNPSDGQVSFVCPNANTANGSGKIYIFSSLGERIFGGNLDGNEKLSVDCSGFSPGVYFYTIKRDDAMESHGTFLVSH